MMLAEELEADWSQIRVEQGPVDPAFGNPRYVGFKARGGFQATGGSSTVRNFGVPVRQAGAAMRQMLITAAAQKWGVPETECYAEKGTVIHKPSNKRLTYGELADAAAKLPVPQQVTLKKPGEFKLIGKSMPRTDTPSKTNGSARFGIDVKVPEMLTATVVKIPVHGGKLVSFDDAKAKAIKGVRAVVPISSGVAVIADDFWSAKRGADALEIKWDDGPNAKLSSEELSKTYAELAKKPGVKRRSDGDIAKAMETAAKTVNAVYEVPFLDHACMEPMNATAHWKGESVEIWAPTQAQSWNQQAVIDKFGLPREKVVIHTTFLGGGFGRRLYPDEIIDACEASKAVRKPVKVIWTREEDMRHGYYRPATYNVLSAALDKDGMPIAWTHRIVGPGLLTYFKPFEHLVKEGIDPSSVSGAADVFPYAIPNVYVDYTMHNTIPVGFWRSVGHSQNGFVMEGFIDELAHAAGKDPFEYRRRSLSEKFPRHKAVLELAADKAGWGKPLPKGMSRGIAVHFAYGGYCAQVAEVSVNPDGVPKVHRVVCAIDSGWVVNPDTVRAQMESAIAFGLSAALYGKITLKDGRVQQSNYHDYPVLRMNEMPKVEVHILEGEGEQGGVGEPGTPPIAPAVCNAIFAATGKRIRRLPIQTEELKQAGHVSRESPP
jgi:isoquinoline 1-oxidoreductase beta subunit